MGYCNPSKLFTFRTFVKYSEIYSKTVGLWQIPPAPQTGTQRYR